MLTRSKSYALAAAYGPLAIVYLSFYPAPDGGDDDILCLSAVALTDYQPAAVLLTPFSDPNRPPHYAYDNHDYLAARLHSYLRAVILRGDPALLLPPRNAALLLRYCNNIVADRDDTYDLPAAPALQLRAS
jgi:hypothetical protein